MVSGCSSSGMAPQPLWSRQRKDLTRYFPDLVAAAAEHVPPGHIIDGEAVIWFDDRLDFDTLQRRLAAGPRKLPALVREQPANYAAFDLLAVSGQDAHRLPLRARSLLLKELTKDWGPPLGLSPVATRPERGRPLVRGDAPLRHRRPDHQGQRPTL